MRGFFKDGFPSLHIEVAGNAEAARKITVIIDTGFDGHLALPYTEAFPIGLTLETIDSGRMADGTFVPYLRCTGMVMVGEKRVRAVIDVQQNSRCLLGTALLKDLGCAVKIDPVAETVELIEVR